MKILWIVQKDFEKSLDISTWLEMARSLIALHHRVTLVAISGSNGRFTTAPPQLEIKNVPVINHFPFVSISFHLQVLIFGCYWIMAWRPAVVVTHPYTALFLMPAVLVAKLFNLKTKFLLDIRTLPVRSRGIPDQFKKRLHHAAIRAGKKWFDNITVITPALRQMLAEQFHLEPAQIGIWMSGVNTQLFKPVPSRANRNTSLRDSFVIMYHGALAENRGLMETIQAMAIVTKKHPDIQLFILGSGLAHQKLVALTKQLKLTGCISFHEPVNYQKIPDFISQADMGIIPLPDEPCWRVSSPLKLLEYLAMAKPVIVSPIEAHTAILSQCPAALFLKSTRPEDIAEGIVRAYQLRPRLTELGSIGRKFVIENFTWDKQAMKLQEVMQN